jgi:hypothetical protein
MESTSKQNGQTNRGRLLAISASTGEPHPLYSEHHKRIADITERLCMPLVGNEDVVLGFLDNATCPPLTKDNRIRITLWNKPKRARKTYELPPPDGMGQSVDTTIHIEVMTPLPGAATEIKYNSRGPVVAQVFRRHIQVLVNFEDIPAVTGLRIFESILAEGLETLISNGDITSELLLDSVSDDSVSDVCDDEILQELMYSQNRTALNFDTEIRKLLTDIENVNKLIETNGHEILRAANAVGSNEHSLAIEGTLPKLSNRRCPEPDSVDSAFIGQIREEFDLIVTHPLVRYLPHSESPSLTVYSRHIVIRHRVNHALYDMGFYRLVVPLCGPTDYRWVNLTRRIQGYSAERQHPHINAEGSGCLGNARTMMSQALDKGDFYGMVHLGLRFLTSCHVHDSAGKYIVNWPLYRDSDTV